MTLPVGNRTDAVGTNSTGDYDYTFRILTQNDLRVTVRNPDTDVESTLTLTTDYTVDGVGDVTGGQITLVDANQAWLGTGNFLNTDWPITIRGVESLVQDTDIRNQGDYYPEGIEDAFDYQMRISQQQQDEIDRSAKLPETIDPADVDMTLPVPEAGSVIAWNSTADGLENQVPNSSTYLTKATQGQAQAGTENSAYMTPLRVAEAITALVPADAVTLTNTVTLTNKRITPRTDTVASSATPTINTDTTDFFTITALAAAITSFTTNLSGTPTSGQKLLIRIKDDGTGRAITWGASFASRGATLPTTTTASKVTYVGLIWNSTASIWDCVAASTEA